MDKMPKVSVIIPVYQAEKGLKRCIDSILNQTLQDFEIILINDGSTDRSSDICNHYSTMHSNIKVVHQENKGVSAARNNGLTKAIGKYVTFIDSDDYISPQYLERFFSIDPNPKNSIIQQGYTKEFSDGSVHTFSFNTGIYSPPQFSDLFYKENFIRRMPYTWAKMYDKNLLNKHQIRFDPDLSYGEDFIFFLEYLLYVDKFITSNASLYHYTYQSTSLSRNINSYESEMKRMNLVIYYLEKLDEKFGFSEKTKEINFSHVATYFVRAIKGLYLPPHKKSRKNRIKLYAANYSRPTDQIIQSYYNPSGVTQKLFLFIYKLGMPTFLDLYAHLWVHYQIKRSQL